MHIDAIDVDTQTHSDFLQAKFLTSEYTVEHLETFRTKALHCLSIKARG